jgi:hypothetical protein
VNYLLDTNVLCEGTRELPDAKVAKWFSRRVEGTCFISVVSMAEIRKGILMLPLGKKRQRLEAWLAEELLPAFVGRMLSLGEEEMNSWAALQAETEKAGRRMPVVDSLIAATALCHGLTLATRNIGDFKNCKLAVVNPWSPKQR